METIKIYIRSILLPVLVGAIVGLITFPAMQYSSLIQPPIAPPGILFPIVWTILYVLMGTSYGMLKSNNLANDKIDNIYYLQLGVNALWSIFFFIFEWRLFSFLWIIFLAILVVIMIIRFYEKNKIAGLIQIPYLLWIIFVSYLNLSIYILNK